MVKYDRDKNWRCCKHSRFGRNSSTDRACLQYVGPLKRTSEAPKTTSPSKPCPDKVLTFCTRRRHPTWALLQKCRHLWLTLRHSTDKQCPQAPHCDIRLFSRKTSLARRLQCDDDTIHTTSIGPRQHMSLGYKNGTAMIPKEPKLPM